MNKLFPVYTLKNECHDCYRCVRECHVKAIKIKDGHASVLSEKCINCGECVKSCPSNAKRIRYDINRVKAIMSSGKKVYVSLAPTWVGVFDYSASKMIALLKKLGFEGVSETALGAQEVSIKTAEILNKSEKGLYISSACPVIVEYIRLYYPKFAPNIVPIASPALTHAKMLKEQFGEDIAVVFIGPCVAKKSEADRHPNLITVSLTFEELNYWIKEEFIDVNNLQINPNESFVLANSNEGAIYPIEGGMNETIKQVGIDDSTQLLSISSLNAFDKSIKNLDPKKLDKKIFIEALACSGGCINGPCISSSKSTVNVTSNILKNVKYRENVPNAPQTVVEEDYEAKPVESHIYPLNEIEEAMKRIGKYTEEDELNCGGCGYKTCRDLANALISGEAEPSMCVSYMRKIAMQKAAAMLRCMPSAMVMVNNDLNIMEANDSFMKMFCDEAMYEILSQSNDGLKGAAIDRIVDFGDVFKDALKSGKDIHKEHHIINNRIYDISAFTVEKGLLVGAIITDVTKSETNREKIATKAHEVISKNIAIVQNIACLLGEHMVETELLLNSIAQGYDVKTEIQNNEASEK